LRQAKAKVAVLGATGLVGQVMVSMLSNHPWFKLSHLTASSSKAGKMYSDVVDWTMPNSIPNEAAGMYLHDATDTRIDADVVLSALPSDAAANIEPLLAEKGYPIISNASNMRLESDIPLINPEVNAHHLERIACQRRKRGWDGFIVKVPNCSTAILTLPLKPIQDECGLREVFVVTMQSVSGAGLKGPTALKILGNIIPHIEKEEWKIENETRKILDRRKGCNQIPDKPRITASANRVPVKRGHLLSIFIKTTRICGKQDIVKAIENFTGNKIRGKNFPIAPKKPIRYIDRRDRPQPVLDIYDRNGMTVSVGNLREDMMMHSIKLTVVGDNLVRGAAGTAILIGEIILENNYI
jgi:aspartate-semialdehyde dehydrogenase